MDLIDNLKWRYATKKFDTTKKVSDKDIDFIKESIQLSASSYGLQAYQIVDVKDAAIREKLQPASWGQTQITEASHLFVFCNSVDVSNEQIDEFVQLKSDVTGVELEKLSGYGDFMKGTLSKFPAEMKEAWTSKQVYIALGTALAACAELKIDSTPIEGFEPPKYNEILGLSEKGLNASVVLAIGYRHEEDHNQSVKKVRKPMDKLFMTV